MPAYQFRCKKCNKVFLLSMPLAEYEKGGFKCPACNGTDVEQVPAAFFAVSAKKS